MTDHRQPPSLRAHPNVTSLSAERRERERRRLDATPDEAFHFHTLGCMVFVNYRSASEDALSLSQYLTEPAPDDGARKIAHPARQGGRSWPRWLGAMLGRGKRRRPSSAFNVSRTMPG